MAHIHKLSYEEIKSTRPSLEKVLQEKKFPVTVVLENIRSLYNVGSIFRTSDGAFIEKLYLTGYTGHPPRKEIDKTALGSVESVSWLHHEDPNTVVRELKNQGYTTIALEHTTQSVAYTDFAYNYPLCLVVGNEVDGVSEQLLQECNYAIEIPMFGVKQSLNVAVAYGISIYHIMQDYVKKVGLNKK